MRKIISAAAMLLAVVLMAPAAGADETSIQVDGGDLSTTSSNVTFGNATLTGADQTVNASADSEWSTTDARGTGAAWNVTASSTDLVSAAGTVETTERTIAVNNLAVTVGTVTAGTNSDPADTLTAAADLALSGTDQDLLSSAGDNKGTYSYTPGFDLNIPANAYRSNYEGEVGTTALNPYTATVTITTS